VALTVFSTNAASDSSPVATQSLAAVPVADATIALANPGGTPNSTGAVTLNTPGYIASVAAGRRWRRGL